MLLLLFLLSLLSTLLRGCRSTSSGSVFSDCSLRRRSPSRPMGGDCCYHWIVALLRRGGSNNDDFGCCCCRFCCLSFNRYKHFPANRRVSRRRETIQWVRLLIKEPDEEGIIALHCIVSTMSMSLAIALQENKMLLRCGLFVLQLDPHLNYCSCT